MKIIDIHSHLEDILYGGDIIEPYSKRVWTPGNLWENSSYRIAGLPGPLAVISRHLEAVFISHQNHFGTLENMIKDMDEFGVTKSVLNPIAPMTDGFQYLKKVKGNERFLVFAGVSPHDPDKEKKLKDQIAAGCVGLKLHPILQNAAPNHRGYFEIMEIFRAYKMPVLFHSGVVHYYVAYQPTRYGYGEPRRYEELIKAFRDVPTIMGHMGMRQGEQVIELARKYDNLYADSSQQRLSLLKKGAQAFGKDRLMFGSDWAFGRQSTPIRIGLKLTNGDPEFQEKFFWKNAASLLPAKSISA